MHSIHSDDGDFHAGELVEMAKAAGLTTIALSDHNTASGVEEALAAGKRLGVEVVPAIELDCEWHDVPLHVLGYCIDHRDPALDENSKRRLAREQQVSAARINLVQRLGIHLDRDAVMAQAREGVVTGESMAELALADPANADNPLLAPLRPGGSRSDNPFVNFYWDFCAKGKAAHVPIESIDFSQSINLIRNAGGVAVLAHPGINLKGKEELLAELAKNGLAGVEAFSSYHDPAACQAWKAKADRLGLIPTSGSDFHGKTKPAVRLGGHGGDGLEPERLALLKASVR